MTPLDLILVFAVAGAGAFLGSYLREKGKNLATREDIAKITRATEEIKAEISGQLWEVQTRWSFKRDLYIRLLEGLGDAAFALRQLSFLDEKLKDPRWANSRGETERYLNEYLDTLGDHVDKLRAAQAVAPIVLRQDALDSLDELLAVWVKTQSDYNAESFEALRAVVIRTMTRLTVAAKQDLLVRSAEGDKKA